jgi:hypothetical protein
MRSCSFRYSDTSHHTKSSHDDHQQRIRVTACHHPLVDQVLNVIQKKFSDGEFYFIVELPTGHRQLLAQRHTEAVTFTEFPPSPSLRFSPGSLRALARMVNTLQQPPESRDGASVSTAAVEPVSRRRSTPSA